MNSKKLNFYYNKIKIEYFIYLSFLSKKLLLIYIINTFKN